MTISADFLEEIFGENLADLTIMDEAPYFIGMMSGTSLDGMDAVLCRFLKRMMKHARLRLSQATACHLPRTYGKRYYL